MAHYFDITTRVLCHLLAVFVVYVNNLKLIYILYQICKPKKYEGIIVMTLVRRYCHFQKTNLSTILPHSPSRRYKKHQHGSFNKVCTPTRILWKRTLDSDGTGWGMGPVLVVSSSDLPLKP